MDQITSPLLPVQPDTSGNLGAWTTLGVALQLALEHEDLNTRTVGDWIGRLQPALEAGQCHIFLDEEHRPFGFASWIAADLNKHQRWLQGDASLPSDWRAAPRNEQELHLWIVDFVVPFGFQLQALQHMQALLPEYNAAWTFGLNAETESDTQIQMPPRRLW